MDESKSKLLTNIASVLAGIIVGGRLGALIDASVVHSTKKPIGSLKVFLGDWVFYKGLALEIRSCVPKPGGMKYLGESSKIDSFFG